MDKETKSYDLKLPSDANVVRPENIWKTSISIANFGKTFTDIELSKTGTPVNENNLNRILSYMRYLGLVYEKREKRLVNGKNVSLQLWIQNEDKDVQDYYFFLQDKRYDEGKKILKHIIENNDIFQSIKNDLLTHHKVVTEIDLKDYLRRQIPNKSVRYYTAGTEFIINLLTFCDLLLKEGNKIKLRMDEDDIEKGVDKDVEKLPKSDETNAESEKIKCDGRFVIKIEGKDGMTFRHNIDNESDLDDVGALLAIIRKKINKNR